LEAVKGAFGADVDYAQLVKLYGPTSESAKGRYSPAECIGARKEVIEGNPDRKHIRTSFAEHSNLTIWMHTRRFTRLTDALSKKLENHAHAVALHTLYYNLVRSHRTLRMTPAMAAGVTKRLWEMPDVWNCSRRNLRGRAIVMSKYDPLRDYLQKQSDREIELTFKAIESLLGFTLPESAMRHQWWANVTDKQTSHTQRNSWRDAGFDAFLIAGSRKVRFRKIR
jgi:hypothetical protein